MSSEPLGQTPVSSSLILFACCCVQARCSQVLIAVSHEASLEVQKYWAARPEESRVGRARGLVKGLVCLKYEGRL